MDSPGQRNAASKIILVLRRATRLVKILPFVYLLVFTAYMLMCSFVPDAVLCALDGLLVVSPAVSGLFVVLSRMFNLCRWHIAACLIPTASNVEGFIDGFLVTLTSPEVIAINLAIGVGSLLFLISANNHFYGRKAISA